MTVTPELEQARYAWERTQHNVNPGTVRWSIEAMGLLDKSDGPEARRFLRLRRFLVSLLKSQAEDLGKAVRRAARYGLKAPVYTRRRDRLHVVRGDFLVAKQQLWWQCPYCGEKHCHRTAGVPSRDTLACPKNAAHRCEVEVKFFRATIPAYIPPPRSA